MLHQSTNPPQVLPTAGEASSRPPSAFSVISATIQPIGIEPDLLDTLCSLREANDVGGMIDLYDAFAAAGTDFMDRGAKEDSVAASHMDAEGVRAWSKAYLVADFLKRMRPTEYMAERYAHTLFDATYRMGGTLEEVAAVIAEIATWELERPVPPSMVR